MHDSDLRALLGDAYADTTDEQRDAISRAADAIDTRWTDPDDEGERREALTGALLVILGDDTDERIARRASDARHAYLDAQAALTGAIIAGAIVDPLEGELPRASRLGVARMTVRKALGK